MATVRKRGETYQIRVSCGMDSQGKQVVKTCTWKPAPGMTAKQIEDALEYETQRFEDSLKKPDYEKDLIESIFLDAFGVDFDFAVEAVEEALEVYGEKQSEYLWLLIQLEFKNGVNAFIVKKSIEKSDITEKAKQYFKQGFKNLFVYKTTAAERETIGLYGDGEKKFLRQVEEKFKYFVPYKLQMEV